MLQKCPVLRIFMAQTLIEIITKEKKGNISTCVFLLCSNSKASFVLTQKSNGLSRQEQDVYFCLKKLFEGQHYNIKVFRA